MVQLPDDYRNEPSNWKYSCRKLLNALKVIREGEKCVPEVLTIDSSMVAMMIAGYAFENAFKAYYLKNKGDLFINERLTNFKNHRYCDWTQEIDFEVSKLELEALDKAEYFVSSWGRYPFHNKEHRISLNWSWSEIDRIESLCKRLVEGI